MSMILGGNSQIGFYRLSYILSWFEAWLTQREQQVTIEGDKSSTAKGTSGVPQGTVLTFSVDACVVPCQKLY
jgi:hypothetical protein